MTLTRRKWYISALVLELATESINETEDHLTRLTVKCPAIMLSHRKHASESFRQPPTVAAFYRLFI